MANALDAAAQYVQRGWRVTPGQGKAPIQHDWSNWSTKLGPRGPFSSQVSKRSSPRPEGSQEARVE